MKSRVLIQFWDDIETVEKLDSLAKYKGNTDRSKLIREALRKFFYFEENYNILKREAKL